MENERKFTKSNGDILYASEVNAIPREIYIPLLAAGGTGNVGTIVISGTDYSPLALFKFNTAKITNISGLELGINLKHGNSSNTHVELYDVSNSQQIVTLQPGGSAETEIFQTTTTYSNFPTSGNVTLRFGAKTASTTANAYIHNAYLKLTVLGEN